MKIRLNEIPQEGREYILNRNTAELNQVLQDLIEDKAYSARLYIRPLNTKDFIVEGQIETYCPEQCSRCAEEFDLKIRKKINEILIPQQQDDRVGKYSKTNVNSDSEAEVSVTEYKQQQFDLGEFLHENVALEIPFNPHCENCSSKEQEKPYSYDEKMGEDEKPNPFQALKDLKLN